MYGSDYEYDGICMFNITVAAVFSISQGRMSTVKRLEL